MWDNKKGMDVNTAIICNRLCSRTVVPAGHEGERAGSPGAGNTATRSRIIAGQVVFIVPLKFR